MTDPTTPAARKRQVVVFVSIVLVVSFALEAWMIRSAGGLGALGGLAVVILMWIPAIVSLLMRVMGREGFRDVGWRAGPWRFWLVALLLPAVLAGATYLSAWLVGAVVFSPRSSQLPIESVHLRWLAVAAINGALGAALGIITAFGEELGWRGYLLTRWKQSGLRFPLLGSGLVWGIWHVPVILWGDYATSSHPWVSALLFLVCICLANVVFSWLRLTSGSVWVASIVHASHNAFYQASFDRHFSGELEPYLAGEAGLFSILAYGAVVVWLARSGRLRKIREAPVWFAVKQPATPSASSSRNGSE